VARATFAEGLLVTLQVAGLFGVTENVAVYKALVATEPVPAHVKDGNAEVTMEQEMALLTAPNASVTRMLLIVTVPLVGLLHVIAPLVALIVNGADAPLEIVKPGNDVNTLKLLAYATPVVAQFRGQVMFGKGNNVMGHKMENT